jgi:hypothetical protein
MSRRMNSQYIRGELQHAVKAVCQMIKGNEGTQPHRKFGYTGKHHMNPTDMWVKSSQQYSEISSNRAPSRSLMI